MLKIYFQAQESPEPVYDISDCALKSVPTGVYSKIKISRKEALLLNVSNDLYSKMLYYMVPFIPHATNGSTLIVPNERHGSSNFYTMWFPFSCVCPMK